MNTLTLQRLTKDQHATVGLLSVNGVPICFTLEDRFRAGAKVKGDTRIPAGEYRLAWRTGGKWGARFRAMGYPGVLHVLDVPGFQWILYHTGNRALDTAGCPLPGLGADLLTRTVSRSRDACKKLYDKVALGGEWRNIIRD